MAHNRYSTNGSTYTTIPSSAYTINNTSHTITISNYEVPTTLDYQSQGTYYLKVVDKFTEDVENEPVTRGIPTTEKGERDFQVNGDLFIADESRQNKAPLNVSGNVSKNLVNVSDRTITYSQQVGELITRNLSNITVSFNYNNTGSVNGVCRIQDINGNNIKSIVANANSSNFVSTSLDVSNYDYVKFVFQGTGSGYNYSFSNFQVEQGSTATEYEEYYEPTLSIRTSNGIFQEVDINEDNYSLGEQVVGTYLGKPLYKRTFNATSPSQTSSSDVIITLASECIIRKYEGMLQSAVNAKYQLNTWFSDSDYIYIYVDSLYKLRVKVGHTSYTSRPIEITLWYTKN